MSLALAINDWVLTDGLQSITKQCIFFLRNAIENSREMLCVKKLQGIFCYQWKLRHTASAMHAKKKKKYGLAYGK